MTFVRTRPPVISQNEALTLLLACMIYLWLSWTSCVSLRMPPWACIADAASHWPELRCIYRSIHRKDWLPNVREMSIPWRKISQDCKVAEPTLHVEISDQL